MLMTPNPNKSAGFFLLDLITKAYKAGETPIAFFSKEDTYDKLVDLLNATHPLLLSIPEDADENEYVVIEFNDIPIIPDDAPFEELGVSEDTALMLKTLPGITGPTLKDIFNESKN